MLQTKLQQKHSLLPLYTTPSTGPPTDPNLILISSLPSPPYFPKKGRKKKIWLCINFLSPQKKIPNPERLKILMFPQVDLIQKYIGTPMTITNAIRLGSKGAKPRLLKISVSSKHEKGLILKNCVKLCNKTILQISKKFISLPWRNNWKIRL